MNSFSPLEELENATRRWWILVLLMLAGGLTGYAVHLTRPPLYEARASVSITIDYAQTGNLDLTDEDMMLDVAGKLVFTRPVREAVLAQALAEGLQVDEASLQRDARLERRLEEWDLIFRHPDADTAARMVNLWMQLGMEALEEAGEHARLAHAYRMQLSGLEGCLSGAGLPGQATPTCPGQSLTEIQARAGDLTTLLMAELQASQGLSPAILFSLKSLSEVPETPASLGRNSMILAGGLIGLVMGIWVITSRFTEWLAGRLHSG